MPSILRFLRRSREERRAVRTAFARLALAYLRHRRTPGGQLVTELRAAAARAAEREGAKDAPPAQVIAWAIGRAAALAPFRSDCLIQALAAQTWLEALGRSYSFHLAVESQGALIAHAWIESDGVVISGGALSPELSRFGPDGTGGPTDFV